jgi:transcriptional repressor NrdR
VKCGHRFTTFERAESARIQVVKRDGSREEFDRAKLASSLTKAGGKSLTPEKVAKVVDGIEAALRQSGTSEIDSQRLGQAVLEQLESIDPMAYIRFKIVYAGLQDPDALYDELGTLVRRRQLAREAAEQISLPLDETARQDRPRAKRVSARRR